MGGNYMQSTVSVLMAAIVFIVEFFSGILSSASDREPAKPDKPDKPAVSSTLTVFSRNDEFSDLVGKYQPEGARLNFVSEYIDFEDYDDVLADGIWQQFFTEKPEILTREEKRAWLDTMTGVALGSDAFFPFGDNIERAHKSGVSYIAQPGGSVRDDHVIGTCDKYNMAMAFTGIRLFHH